VIFEKNKRDSTELISTPMTPKSGVSQENVYVTMYVLFAISR